jgi:ribosomal protein L7/L12
MNAAIILSGLIGAGIALLFIKLSQLDRRLNRLSRVDAKVDALLMNAGVEFDEFQNVPADVREALEHGETILAIQRFRAATGTGLKEAKEFVDEVRRGRTGSWQVKVRANST